MLCNSCSLPCMSMPAALEPIFFRMLPMLPDIKQKVSLALNCGLTVVGVYVPNSGQQLARLDYRVNVAELHFIDCRFCWFGSVTSSCSIALLHFDDLLYLAVPRKSEEWDKSLRSYLGQDGRVQGIFSAKLRQIKEHPGCPAFCYEAFLYDLSYPVG